MKVGPQPEVLDQSSVVRQLCMPSYVAMQLTIFLSHKYPTERLGASIRALGLVYCYSMPYLCEWQLACVNIFVTRLLFVIFPFFFFIADRECEQALLT